MHIKKLKEFFILTLLAGFLLSFLLLTNPNDLPLIALFVPFLLVYAVAFIIAKFIVRALIGHIAAEHQRWVAGFIASIPVAMLLVVSAGQSDRGDVALFVIFLVLVIFYLRRAKFLK